MWSLISTENSNLPAELFLTTCKSSNQWINFYIQRSWKPSVPFHSIKINWKMHWTSMTNSVQSQDIFWNCLQLSNIAFVVDLCFSWFAYWLHTKCIQVFVAGISLLSKFHSEAENPNLSVCYLSPLSNFINTLNSSALLTGSKNTAVLPCLCHKLTFHWHWPPARVLFSLLSVSGTFGCHIYPLLMWRLSHITVDFQSLSYISRNKCFIMSPATVAKYIGRKRMISDSGQRK